MTIKSIKDLGFNIVKKPNQRFLVTKNGVSVEIKKVTDTKFSYAGNSPTANVNELIQQIGF
jgi:hypothetical protein